MSEQQKQQDANAYATPSTTNAAVVPVEHEPNHREVWKSDSVRLVHVQIPPHKTCLWHRHLKYGVYIVIKDLDATEQSRDGTDRALTKSKGDVFCRDHTEDHLIHSVAVHDTGLDIIEVELLHEKHTIAPHDDDVPQHVARGVRCLHAALECRVYRIELLSLHVEDVALELSTAAVLVALDECVVTIFNPSAPTDVLANERHLTPGDDVALVAGQFEIKLVTRDHPESIAFVLTEVY